MNLDGYLGALGQLPSYAQMQSAAAQLRGEKLDNQFRENQIGAQDRAQAQEAAFEADVKALGANPTVSNYRALAARYPKFAEGINNVATGMEKSRREQIIGDSSQIYSALGNKQPQIAAGIFKRHIEADKAAGREPDPTDTALLEMIESGDPEKIKAARGMVFATINGIDSKAAEGLAEGTPGATTKGIVVGRAVGHYVDGKWTTDYRDPDPPFTLSPGQRRFGSTEGGGPTSDPGAVPPPSGGSRYQYGWTPRARNGGDNPDNVVDNKISGMTTALGVGPDDSLAGKSPMDIAKALTLSEGGAGSLADKNNNPGNLTDGKGNFRKFPTKEAGLAAAAAQVARNLRRGQTTIRSMVEGLPAGGPQSGSSDPQPIASVPATPKAGYRMLTPEENTQNGLDPNVRYQMGPDGQITALGGQSKAQLKSVPQQIVTKVLENRKALRNIDDAVAKINKYPDAIGYWTGTLGNSFTQWNDPKGVDARAAITNIGSLILHDRSGAAVTVAETPRLVPFIPLTTDTADAAKKKLTRLRAEIADINDDYETQFSEDQGYRPIAPSRNPPAGRTPPAANASPPKVNSIQQAMRLPKGTVFIDPNGVRRVR